MLSERAAGAQRLRRRLRGGSVAYEGDRVVFVGRGDAGPADHRIDATGKLADVAGPGDRPVRQDHGHTDDEVADVQQRFEDILKGPLVQAPGPIPQELNEYPELPRLIIPFNRSSYSRLRRLIDHVNEHGGPETITTPPAIAPA